VTEESNPDFTVVGDPSQQITIQSGTNTVTFNNTRNTGSLAITKNADAPGTFTFDVSCDNGTTQTVTVTVGDSGTATSDPIIGIPTGTVCTVTEESNPDFTVVGDPSQQITIQSGTNTVTFNNTRRVGSLTITKASDAPGTFTFDVSCDNGTTTTVTITVDGSGTPTAGTPIDGIPTGTVCTVHEEPATGFFPQDDQSVTIAEGVNTLAFTNVAEVRGLTLVKAVSAASAVAGDVLTYSFTASTTGNAPQTDVVVTDVLPDGVTYVDGSATCAAPCVATYDGATNTVTWALGDLGSGTTVSGLSYNATVDPVTADTTIRNTGVIASTEVAPVTSNEVTTKVATVLGIVLHKKPTAPPPAVKGEASALPFTGPALPIDSMLEVGMALLAAGVGLRGLGSRSRRYQARHAG
jgi:uncharacterized repeat protein (TIGR01451 family)